MCVGKWYLLIRNKDKSQRIVACCGAQWLHIIRLWFDWLQSKFEVCINLILKWASFDWTVYFFCVRVWDARENSTLEMKRKVNQYKSNASQMFCERFLWLFFVLSGMHMFMYILYKYKYVCWNKKIEKWVVFIYILWRKQQMSEFWNIY